MPQFLVDEAEAWAKETSISRAEAFRKLIEMGLEARKTKQRKAKR
jgi:metal-responsive CopG/Arc/MetJ family transcriptional regulator